jgi:hypothetical protein
MTLTCAQFQTLANQEWLAWAPINAVAYCTTYISTHLRAHCIWFEISFIDSQKLSIHTVGTMCTLLHPSIRAGAFKLPHSKLFHKRYISPPEIRSFQATMSRAFKKRNLRRNASSMCRGCVDKREIHDGESFADHWSHPKLEGAFSRGNIPVE